MKVEIPKEWSLKMAALEGDAEIGAGKLPPPAKVRVIYRGRPWGWYILRPLHGTGYRAFWFGPFKIIVRN